MHKNRLQAFIRENPIIKPLFLLISGTSIAQLISFLLAPAIARLYSPEEMGVYSLLATAVSQFGPVIGLKYDMGVIMADTNKDAVIAFKLSVLICLITSPIIAAVYSIFNTGQAGLQISYITSFLTILSLLCAYGFIVAVSAFNNRHNNYKIINISTILRSAGSNGLLVITGFLKFGVIGIILSHVIAEYSGVFVQANDFKERSDAHEDIKVKTLMNYARKNKNFPLYNASAAIITTSVYSVINLFIISMYTSTELGLYSMSYRILGIPFILISGNIARLYFKYASDEMKLSGSFKLTFRKTLRLLMLAIIPIMVFLGVFSPYLVDLLLGHEWKEAGNYIRLLIPMFAAKLIGESLLTTYTIAGHQKTEFTMQVKLLITEIMVFMILKSLGVTIELMLISISAIYVIFYVYSLFIMHKLSMEVISK